MCSKEIAEVMVILRQYMERVGTLEVQLEEQKQEIHRQRMERIKFELQSNMTHYKHERRIETLEKQLQELEPERRVQKRQATLLPWSSASPFGSANSALPFGSTTSTVPFGSTSTPAPSPSKPPTPQSAGPAPAPASEKGPATA
ncbi:hypothetical protein Trisim1_011157 [Trichoderma cf. simile WF8]